jgi:hypothetical protein
MSGQSSGYIRGTPVSGIFSLPLIIVGLCVSFAGLLKLKLGSGAVSMVKGKLLHVLRR